MKGIVVPKRYRRVRKGRFRIWWMRAVRETPTLSDSLSKLASPNAPTTTAMTSTVKKTRGNRSKGCARSTGSTWRANPIGAHLLFHPPSRFRPSASSPTCQRYRRYPRRRPRVSSRYRLPYRRGRPTPPEPNRLAPKCVASESPKRPLIVTTKRRVSSICRLVNCGPFLTAFMCKKNAHFIPNCLIVRIS